MNTNDPNSSKNQSKQPSKNSGEKQPLEPTLPTTPPLSSPNEPTRAYPTDPSKTYSSDPSQYAYDPNKPAPDASSKVYTTEPLDTARVASDNMRSSENQARRERETFRNQNQQTSNPTGGGGKKEDFYTYATSNKENTITYILLVLGLIILLFSNNLLGGLILGMVAGFYFAPNIIYYIRNLGQIVRGQDHIRYVVLTALVLGLFIAVPGIFIGAIIVAAFKQVMAGPRDSSHQ